MRIIDEEIKDDYRYTTFSNGTTIKQLVTAIENIPTEIEQTNTEHTKAQLLLNQQEIIINQQSQDDVLAAILLSQQTL